MQEVSKVTKISVVTTFPNEAFDIYAKAMVESFYKFWPKDVDLYIHLDDDKLVSALPSDNERPHAFVDASKRPDHKAFLERNRGKDSPSDYRKQALRFSHKPAALVNVIEFMNAKPEHKADYLIWLDADTITKAPVTHEWLQSVLPESNHAVSYLGRMDWPHSECGFIGFSLCQDSIDLIGKMWNFYLTDEVFKQQQWDDSWLFDLVRKEMPDWLFRNLSLGIKGNNVWPKTRLAECMEHFKGPVAKNLLQGTTEQKNAHKMDNVKVGGIPLHVQTMNAVPETEILSNISKNRNKISKWLKMCKAHRDKAVVCSAGVALDIDEVRKLYDAGHKVIAVKHAVKRLVEAGINPWAVILLDPRGHVADFVKDIPKETYVFVASQCNPKVADEVKENGNRIIGYHAPVAVNHEWEHGDFLIGVGTATATRGLHMLHALGFRDFELFGYDLCYFRKPDLSTMSELGNQKYMEVEINTGFPYDNDIRHWWTEGQFVAQINEMRDFLMLPGLTVRAHGEGVVSWLYRSKKRSDLIEKSIRDKMPKLVQRDLSSFLGESFWTKTLSRMANFLHPRN